MRRITEIIDKMGLEATSPAADLINASYIFSAKCHSGQLRKSGEPYLMHPLEVAYILSEMGMDAATVSTGLLHDTVEDTHATIEEIEEQFGVAVANMVDGVTKISQIEFTSAAEKAYDTAVSAAKAQGEAATKAATTKAAALLKEAAQAQQQADKLAK